MAWPKPLSMKRAAVWRRNRYASDPDFRARVKRQNHKAQEAKRRIDKDFRARKNLNRKRNHYIECYGITVEEWEAMLVRQGGRCALCDADTPTHRKGWHTDHDHASGVVRGLLCGKCNTALGWYEMLAKGVGLDAVQRYLDGWPRREHLVADAG